MTRRSTVNYTDVPILKPGTYTDLHGRRVTFTADDLAQLAGSFDPQHFMPSVNIDHSDSGPALGSVKALNWDGEYLRADLANVPRELAAQIDSGRYPHRSAEIYPDLEGRGRYLRAVALLGARPPAVKGLPPMPAANTQTHSSWNSGRPQAGPPSPPAVHGRVARQETKTTINFTHSTIGGTND